MAGTKEGQKVTKKFLSEHTDGSVVDLSLCFLQEIPINELVRNFCCVSHEVNNDQWH